jgi:16S rRNA (guanine527-N7)-methyltransferase
MIVAGTSDRERALALMNVSRETEDLFAHYVALLERWQAIKNLVGPSTLPEVWTRHIADSAQLASLKPKASRWIDLGSGAGFPGLVTAILVRDRPGAHVVLVESNGRKCAFLREVVRQLDLPARVVAGRIEDVIDPFVGEVDVVTARALAPLVDLLRLSRKLLTSGAVGLFPKGQDVGDELTDASRYWRIESSTVVSKTDPKARIVIVDSVSLPVS